MPKQIVALIAFTAVFVGPTIAQLPDTVFLDELTWTEVRDLVDNGTTTVIIATAGTEQNGPHMVLGKHKFIVSYAAEQIARRLGATLVAPVIAYVPEGSLDPPTGHMRYSGAITLPQEHFMTLLEFTARSLAVHGFTDIVFIGDSGGNQNGMRNVSETLNMKWAGTPSRVHFVGDYYSDNGVNDWLISQGETQESIGSHAGIRDTSQLMFIAPQHIRDNKRVLGGGFEGSGVSGDPSRASVEYGEKAIELKIEAALRQIQELFNAG
jgi:creatinine amidohydrolase/Fe(II)-dependent formamide hydrolase-like protein